MKTSLPITPDTKLNTANAYLEERELKKGIVDKLEAMHTDIEVEKMMAQENGEIHPIVEAPRDIIEYLNRGKMIKAFDRIGYCIYNNVIICEVGKKDQTRQLIEDSNTLSPQDLRVVKK